MFAEDNYDLAWLLNGEDVNDDHDDEEHMQGLHQREPAPAPRAPPLRKQGCSRRRGRRSVELSYPHNHIIDSAKAFVEANGFEAHRRRHTTTGNCGVTLEQIRLHLYQSIPGLRETHPRLSVSTIHHWMKPPSRRVKNARRYSGRIDAKVAAKKNNVNQEKPDTHYCRARVKLALEMLADLGESTAAISMDNKNKVHIGEHTLAVDRRLQPGRFFPTTDAPNYRDHDFPTPGYLITPAGYLVMEPGTRETYKDDKGREHLRFSRSGTTYVINRAPTSLTNIETHMEDVLPIVQELHSEGRTSILLLTDNGPDFNPRSHVNLFFYGELWRRAKLDALGVMSYSAGDSKLNPVERVWGILTKKLTGVYLTDILQGEDSAPRRQSLPEASLHEKEQAVFNQSMRLLDKYWNGLCYDGYPLYSRHIPAGGLGEQSLTSVQSALQSKRQLHSSPHIMESTYLTSAHLQRLDGMLIFTKCQHTSCHHCTNHPIQNPAACTAFRNFKTPAPSAAQETYSTYLQSRSLTIAPDQYMPSRAARNLGKCSKCRCYLFTSEADKVRHQRLLH